MPNNAVRAAAEGMPSINRRAILTGTAAVALAATSLPVAAVASPIRALFQQWEQITALIRDDNHFAALDKDADNAEMSRLCSRQHELILQMVALPCGDTGDFAMKVIVVTGDGEFALDDFAPGILADARAMLAGGVS